MRAVNRARLSALVFFALAATTLAIGSLLFFITPLGSSGWAVAPVAAAAVGSVIMFGAGLADLRYARRLERFMDRINK